VPVERWARHGEVVIHVGWRAPAGIVWSTWECRASASGLSLGWLWRTFVVWCSLLHSSLLARTCSFSVSIIAQRAQLCVLALLSHVVCFRLDVVRSLSAVSIRPASFFNALTSRRVGLLVSDGLFLCSRRVLSFLFHKRLSAAIAGPLYAAVTIDPLLRKQYRKRRRTQSSAESPAGSLCQQSTDDVQSRGSHLEGWTGQSETRRTNVTLFEPRAPASTWPWCHTCDGAPPPPLSKPLAPPSPRRHPLHWSSYHSRPHL